MNLKSLFPHGSNAFFNANCKNNHQIQSSELEQDPQEQVVGLAEGKEKSLGRVTLSFKGCFVKLKDPDNFVGGLKDLIDGLVRLRLIPGDEADKIKIVCEQEKVAHFASERIELKITYPRQ